MQRTYELHDFSDVSGNTNAFHTINDYSHVTSIVHMERDFKWAGLTTEAACAVGAAAVLLWLSRLFVNEAPLKKIQVDVLTNTVNVLAFIYIIS